MLDILNVGDSVIDIFLKIPRSDTKFSLDKQQNKLLINYGEKISIEKYVVGIGGNATNTAVGCARLGLKSGLLAEIGTDEFSNKIISTLKRENVNTEYVKTSDKQTSITVALSYDGDRTLFTEHVNRDHNFNLESVNTKMIYLTSLGHTWEKAYEKVYEYIRERNDTILAFNPGSLQLENKSKYVLDIIEETDYLFVNKQEAEEILYGKELGLKAEDNKNILKKLLFGLKSLGAKNVIITDSDNGSYMQSADNKTYHLEIVNVDVLEKTGAGDSYTAGFMAAILKNIDLKQAMVWGAINSSNVIKYIGAQEGLLKENEILNVRNNLTYFTPKEI